MILAAERALEMRTQLLGRLENEHKTTLAVLEHLPEDKLDYTPHEKSRPFGAVFFHIYNTGTWFADVMATGQVDFSGESSVPPAPRTKAALLEACRQMNQAMIQRISSLPASALTREIPFASFGTYPAVTYLEWHLNHLVHHRGQLTVYLRMMGAKVPQVYGDSLDYPMSM